MTETFRNNTAQSQFELYVDGGTAHAAYQNHNGVLNITHVVTPEHLRGGGVAGRLMQQVADLARTENFKIYPICPYAVTWLRKHPDYADVVVVK